jgi:hypothetical protein
MRSIFAAIITVSASTAVVHTAEARNLVRSQPAYGYRQAPAGHRQPTQDGVTGANQVQFDKKIIEKDNELLDLPPTQGKVIGADELQSKDNALARMIGQENSRLDREISRICRGC